jgi:flagellar motor switch protein FliN
VRSYLDCWISTATALFSQALAGEPGLSESQQGDIGADAVGFRAILDGDVTGSFTVFLDPAIFESRLHGEGVDQQAAWAELLREVAEAAAGELLAMSGKKCRIDRFEVNPVDRTSTRSFQLKSVAGSWMIQVSDEVEGKAVNTFSNEVAVAESAKPASSLAFSQGIELLLDVELETALRFGCCEMALSEILDLGPGDLVELDRHVADPVDLIVGDKIVARGEVVLVGGNFGLRVTEVAAPRMRLDSIRCLF